MASSIFRSNSAGTETVIEFGICEPNSPHSYAATRATAAERVVLSGAHQIGCEQRWGTAHAAVDSIRQRAVLRLHFIVLEHDGDHVFSLTINVRRFLRDQEVFVGERGRWTKDGFHLFFGHPLHHLIDVRLGDAFAGTVVEPEHEHDHEHESQDGTYRPRCSHQLHFHYLSHSPITKSRLPSTAGTSLIRQPGSSSGRILRFTNEGARIFSRYGTPPPLLLM